MTTSIEITQDSEYDELDGVGPAVPVFWGRGHGHDPGAFIRAVLDYCLDNDVDIPAITGDDAPVDTWQQNVSRDGAIEYRRNLNPSTSGSSWFPITLLDLYRGSRGGTRCSIHGCDQPWSVGRPIQVVIEPTPDDDAPNPRMAVQMWLCRDHSRRFPEPSYRVCLVPVGAEVVLPAPEPASVSR